MRFDALQGALMAVLAAAAPTARVVHAPSTFARDGEALRIAFRRRGGVVLAPHHTRPMAPLEIDVTLTVTGDPASARHVLLAADGMRWRVDVPGGTSDSDFLLTIVAAIDDVTHRLAYTSIVVGATTLQIIGTLYGFDVSGDATSVVNSTVLAKVITGWEQSSIEVQVFSTDRSMSGAMGTLSDVLTYLHTPAARDALDVRGVAFMDSSPIVNIDGLAGPDWETRAAVDLTVVQRVFSHETREKIAAAAGTLTVDGSAAQIDLEVPAP